MNYRVRHYIEWVLIYAVFYFFLDLMISPFIFGSNESISEVIVRSVFMGVMMAFLFKLREENYMLEKMAIKKFDKNHFLSLSQQKFVVERSMEELKKILLSRATNKDVITPDGDYAFYYVQKRFLYRTRPIFITLTPMTNVKTVVEISIVLNPIWPIIYQIKHIKAIHYIKNIITKNVYELALKIQP